MRIALAASAFLVIVLTAVVWLAGVRLFVVQPIGALPDGATVVVAGMHRLNLIDSPDAVCMRLQGGVSLLCRG